MTIIGSELTEQDFLALERSSITQEIALRARIRRVTSAEGAALAGRSDRGDYSGLAIPYFLPGEDHPREYRLRRDSPDLEMKGGKTQEAAKYVSPPGRGNMLYFPPGTLPKMLSDTSTSIVIVEGEKKALAILSITEEADKPRFLPIGLPGVWGWKGKRGIEAGADGVRRPVRGPIGDLDRIVWKGRKVTIVYDSDVRRNPSIQDARRGLARELEGRGADVFIADLPDIEGQQKVGADDFLFHRGQEAMLDLINKAKRFKESADQILESCGLPSLTKDSSRDQIITVLRQLADNSKGLDKLLTAAIKEGAVKKLKEIGIQAPTAMVDAALSIIFEGEEESNGIQFEEGEAFDGAVDGAALLNTIRDTLKTYIFLPDHAAETEALWILHAHALEAFDVSPFLAIVSPEKRCGKTASLELIGGGVPRPLFASNITAPALFRAVEMYTPTLLIDEADTFIGNSDELRGVLNSGHRKKSAFVVRCQGDENEPKLFKTWCPKLIARIGELPDTLADRSIIIRMMRKSPTDKTERMRLDRLEPKLRLICKQAAKWAKDNIQALQASDPKLPEELNDRARDNWRCLVSIADLVGGSWPEEARKAARKLSGIEAGEDLSVRVRLLIDIKGIFESEKVEAISSSNLALILASMEERKWGEFRKGKSITPIQIASLIKPFKITPHQVWINQANYRGYALEDFKDAFNRYVPPPEVLDPLDPNNDAASSPSEEVLEDDGPNTPKDTVNDRKQTTLTPLTVQKPVSGAESEAPQKEPWMKQVSSNLAAIKQRRDQEKQEGML